MKIFKSEIMKKGVGGGIEEIERYEKLLNRWEA
jgi:hypothetical protein